MKSDIKDALSSGNTIGYLTWYDCRSAHVTPTTLKTLFDKHKLDIKHFPDNIKPKHAFQKACRQAQASTSQSSDTRRSVTKIIVDGMSKLVYGVVDLDVNEKIESINPSFSDRVWFDKDNLSVSYDKGHKVSKEIKLIYDKLCGEYTTRDIARMIVRAMDRMCAISLRDAGVIYFIPVAFDKDLHALQNVVNGIGQCNMRVYTIGDGNGNSSGIADAAKSQVQDRVKQMKEKISSIKLSIKEGKIKGKSLENSIEVKVRDFKELKNRCKILADALKIKAEDLEGELDEVSKLIKNELMEIAE
jgi:hypothetical protein